MKNSFVLFAIMKADFLFQIVGCLIILTCGNVSGACTHYPREIAQRKAFLETRQCIEARLKIQRENQQQVSILYSVNYAARRLGPELKGSRILSLARDLTGR